MTKKTQTVSERVRAIKGRSELPVAGALERLHHWGACKICGKYPVFYLRMNSGKDLKAFDVIEGDRTLAHVCREERASSVEAMRGGAFESKRSRH